MKICPKCGHEEPSSAKMCSECGSPLERTRRNPFRDPEETAAVSVGAAEEAAAAENTAAAEPEIPEEECEEETFGGTGKRAIKSSKLPLIIGVAIAALFAVTAGAVVVSHLMKQGGTADPVSSPTAESLSVSPSESESASVSPSDSIVTITDDPTAAVTESVSPEPTETASPVGESESPKPSESAASQSPQSSKTPASQSPQPSKTPASQSPQPSQAPAASQSPQPSQAPAASESPKPSQTVNKTYNGITVTTDYVLKNSASAYLTDSDLSGLSAAQLKLARNEIFARLGRKFNDKALQAYFDSCSWYKGVYSPDEFNSKVTLNAYEKANRDLIKKYEDKLNGGGTSEGKTYNGTSITADYILKNSAAVKLTESDLTGLSKAELDIARNEIYARLGRKFNDKALQAYFDSCSWYKGVYSPDEFNSKVTLSEIESANAKLIADYETKMGYR